MESQNNDFATKHMVVIRNLLEPNLTKFLTSYYRSLKQDAEAHTSRDWTSLNTQGDACGDTVLYSVQPKIEAATGLKLLPAFSIVRMYRKGDRLGHHKDGPANEVGVTICVDRDMDWPLIVDDFKTKHEIILDPGDAVIFKGNKLEHWRDRYKGNTQSQLLLGFVKADGPYANRAMYGRGEPFYATHSYKRSGPKGIVMGQLARIRERYRNMKTRAQGGIKEE